MVPILPFLFGMLFGSLAINRCSHSINYGDLCPNPMISLGSSGHGTDINLTRHHNGTCEFFQGDNQVTVVGGIHVLGDTPWPFRGAVGCNYAVKFLLDRNSPVGKQGICGKELGMKVYDAVSEPVLIWHNFSLSQNHFVYEDLISNYGHSSFDLQCTHGPKYVLFLFETFRDSKCTLLVQQYRVNGRQSSCEYQMRTLLQHGLCGAYPCSGVNNILQELKLIARPPTNLRNEPPQHLPRPKVEDESQPKKQVGNPKAKSESEKKVGKSTKIKYGIPTPPTTTESTSNGVLGDQKPIDWAEWAVRLLFPCLGLAFIFLLLRILKGRYVNELCGRQGHPNLYLGSTASMDKQGLQ